MNIKIQRVEKSTLLLYFLLFFCLVSYSLLLGVTVSYSNSVDDNLKISYFEKILRWFLIIMMALGLGRILVLAALGIRLRAVSEKAGSPPAGRVWDDQNQEMISVIIPCHNEEKVIVGTITRLLESRHILPDIIVIDDGSSDGTASRVLESFGHDERVTLVTQPNAGKAAALNHGMRLATSDIIIALDADTHFEPETVVRLLQHFGDPSVGVVAGNVKVGNRHNILTSWQSVEYVTSQNMERIALSSLGAMMVVSGAVGAWRRQAILDAGGFPEDTIAEDQDLTILLQRMGWKALYEPSAIAWTEAPDTVRDFIKQRLRWSYGTLQCLLKHTSIRRDRFSAGIALIAIPQVWLFQVLAALVSPIVDFVALASLATFLFQLLTGIGEGAPVFHFVFFCMAVHMIIEIAYGLIAYKLDYRQDRFPFLYYVSQRFMFRQILYYSTLKALYRYVSGGRVEWGILRRSGRIEMPGS
ncbi:glycosyltransferase [Agrobacterium sp. rho-8.1]|nr:glycosyltransferase [Agrobacterium sp. rho-8.1]